jgi:hypothetical protein
MHIAKPLFVAALFLGLANPAIAQADPHHPEAADTTTTEAETPAKAATPPTPQAGSAMNQCPDMMGMMPVEGQAMPMMHMQMMAMMQMHMQLMQQMSGHRTGSTMQGGADDAPPMQMMEMMGSMQMMQMDMMQMMQQMQKDLAEPGAPAERAKP